MTEEITLMNIAIYTFFSLLNLYTCHLFFKITLSFERFRKKYILISYALFFIISAVINFVIDRPEINLVSGYIGYFLISLLYKSNITKKIIFSIFYTTIGIVLEYMIITVYSISTGITLETILENNNLVFFMYALVNFIPFVCIKLYSTINKNGITNSNNISNNTLLQLVTVPLVSIVILYEATVAIEYSLYYKSLLITFSTILINFVFLNFYEKINISAEEKIEKITLDNQIKYYISLYNNLNKERDDALELRHNIKNHLINIKSLVVKEHNKEAVEEIDNILESTYQDHMYISDIPVIDAIVNYKNQQAKEHGIKIEISIDLHDEINISDADLANVLGNSLDNSIEACIKNKLDSNKIIKLYIEQRKNSVYIRVSNPYEEEIKLKNNLPLSSKRKNEYGIGIRTIEKIVKDKNNIMNISLDNQVFELEIVIFSAIK